MSFLGGYEFEENPGLGRAQDALRAARDRVLGTKSAGNRWWRSLLSGAMKGDFSGIADSGKADAAALKRENAAMRDPFDPVGAQRVDLADSKVDERAGINRYNEVNQALQGAAGGNANFNLAKMQGDITLSQQESENELAAQEGHQTSGWGGMLMQGLIGGASAAATGGAALGWKPFA